MVAEKGTFAFFAFSFPKSDLIVFSRLIGFSHLISDFGISYRVSNQIFTSLFQIVFSRLKLDCHIAFPN